MTHRRSFRETFYPEPHLARSIGIRRATDEDVKTFNNIFHKDFIIFDLMTNEVLATVDCEDPL